MRQAHDRRILSLNPSVHAHAQGTVSESVSESAVADSWSTTGSATASELHTDGLSNAAKWRPPVQPHPLPSPRGLAWHARSVPAKERAVTPDSLGAWLIKASPALDPSIATSPAAVTSRCVRPSYRTDLVRAGQWVLFWLSGGSVAYPPGIYAVGRTTGPVIGACGGAGEPGLSMPVRLRPLETPVLRADLVVDPVLAEIEVIRMPAGSNPSFLTRAQLAALSESWPQLDATH